MGHTTVASDKLGSYRNTQALIEMGCRPQLVVKLTAASMPEVKVLHRRFHGEEGADKGGRKARSLLPLLENHPKHAASSLFYKIYASILALYGVERAMVHTDAFVRALMSYQAADPSGAIDPDQAYLIASLHHTGEVLLTRCKVCPAQYMISSTPLSNRYNTTTGRCPLCYELALLSADRGRVRVTDPKTQREIFRDIIG
ncbi:MAG: hypothetical protein A2580_17985 [Hydrogenophilales bacterium RIFOXYD1_FULL_62_11]|nr:MAG: hypothetical protein A2580_17985 [Hydrogenophilales bacterium RIFOXYD1_FULL_62_11]